MNRRLLVALCVLVFSLAACAGDINLLDEDKLQDTSLLSGEPCEAPCWNDIIPGETSYRDAKFILESDGRFKIAEESEADDERPGRAFSFAEGEKPACCQLISGDGETVSSLMLQLAPTIAFGPVFDKYGEPDFIAGQEVSQEQAYVVMLYLDVPLIVYAHVEGGGKGSVSVSNEMIGAMYLSEAEAERAMTCARLFNWEGFQSFGTYAGVEDEDFDYLGSGVGDEELCPTN